jgi:hypothetical protein
VVPGVGTDPPAGVPDAPNHELAAASAALRVGDAKAVALLDFLHIKHTEVITTDDKGTGQQPGCIVGASARRFSTTIDTLSPHVDACDYGCCIQL